MAEVKSFFDIANIITKKLPRPSDEDIQKYCVIWMLNNYFSCSEHFAPLVAELSTLKLSNLEYFDILYYGIPKTNIFIRYAAQKAKADKLFKDISTHYGVSLEVAKQYAKLMSKEELDQIEEVYEEKGLKKISKKSNKSEESTSQKPKGTKGTKKSATKR